MADKKKSVFQTLNEINVNEHTEKKNGLTYLSWAWAWAELQKMYPDATYEVSKYGEDQKPYIYDENLGYMCHTTITIEGTTREMWLPVMDNKNKAMKNEPYTYQSWNGYKKVYEEKKVEAATMFDINTTIMRCLVKNIGMFGLGLYIYAGEDLPENVDNNQPTPQAAQKPIPQTHAPNQSNQPAAEKKPVITEKLKKQIEAFLNQQTDYKVVEDWYKKNEETINSDQQVKVAVEMKLKLLKTA